jgi:hypothetical protein
LKSSNHYLSSSWYDVSQFGSGKRIVLPFIDDDFGRERREDELPPISIGFIVVAHFTVIANVYYEWLGSGGSGL